MARILYLQKSDWSAHPKRCLVTLYLLLYDVPWLFTNQIVVQPSHTTTLQLDCIPSARAAREARNSRKIQLTPISPRLLPTRPATRQQQQNKASKQLHHSVTAHLTSLQTVKPCYNGSSCQRDFKPRSPVYVWKGKHAHVKDPVVPVWVLSKHQVNLAYTVKCRS